MAGPHPRITIRIAANENSVTIMEGDRVTRFDRSTLDRAAKNKLRRMTVAAWRQIKNESL